MQTTEMMMRDLCLVYIAPSLTQTLSENEGREITRESLAYDVDLQQAGHFIHANALQDPGMGVTLRVLHGLTLRLNKARNLLSDPRFRASRIG